MNQESSTESGEVRPRVMALKPGDTIIGVFVGTGPDVTLHDRGRHPSEPGASRVVETLRVEGAGESGETVLLIRNRAVWECVYPYMKRMLAKLGRDDADWDVRMALTAVEKVGGMLGLRRTEYVMAVVGEG